MLVQQSNKRNGRVMNIAKLLGLGTDEPSKADCLKKVGQHTDQILKQQELKKEQAAEAHTPPASDQAS